VTAFVEDRSVLTRPARSPDAVVRYGELLEHCADVRFGTSRAAQLPLVLMIHGGFWRPAFDRTHTGPMCEALANAGWTTASMEYRRIPGNPDATLADLLLGFAKTPRLIERHNGRVIAMGHSAGGHLALWLAAQPTITLTGVLALAPVADLQFAYDKELGAGAAQAFLGVEAAARKDLDPCSLPDAKCAVTIVHGDRDAPVPIAASERYVARHSGTRLVRVSQCGHFGVIDPLHAAWPRVIEELESLSRT
jgi:acetyl esterase/lipase